jgi:hypothetical protein
MKPDQSTDIIRDTFFELTLCLEAIFLIHKADEDLVEAIVGNMEEIYQNATRNISRKKKQRTYPAIEKFLTRLSGSRYSPKGKTIGLDDGL